MNPQHLIKARAIIEEFTEAMHPEDSGTLAKLLRYIDDMIEEVKLQEEEEDDCS